MVAAWVSQGLRRLHITPGSVCAGLDCRDAWGMCLRLRNSSAGYLYWLECSRGLPPLLCAIDLSVAIWKVHLPQGVHRRWRNRVPARRSHAGFCVDLLRAGPIAMDHVLRGAVVLLANPKRLLQIYTCRPQQIAPCRVRNGSLASILGPQCFGTFVMSAGENCVCGLWFT